MAEPILFYHKDNVIRLSRDIEFLKDYSIQSFLCINLNDVDEESRSFYESVKENIGQPQELSYWYTYTNSSIRNTSKA